MQETDDRREDTLHVLDAPKRIDLIEPELAFDYDNQAWTKDGVYVRCGHPEAMECGCYGREHEGEKVAS